MKTEIIYIDSLYHCHRTNNNDIITFIEMDFFDGKCDAYVEGYCYDTSKGYAQIYPWKPYNELDAAQREYERQKLVEYESIVAELDEALLEAQYQNLIREQENL